MATYTNAIVTTRAAGTISRPNEYGGVLKSIPVDVTIDTAVADDDVIVFSERFGQNTKLTDFALTVSDLGTAATITLYAGSGGTELGTITATTAGTTRFALAPVDISNTQVIGVVSAVTTGATGTVVGTLTFTNDW